MTQAFTSSHWRAALDAGDPACQPSPIPFAMMAAQPAAMGVAIDVPSHIEYGRAAFVSA